MKSVHDGIEFVDSYVIHEITSQLPDHKYYGKVLSVGSQTEDAISVLVALEIHAEICSVIHEHI
jgi:hypothetical protein